MKSQPSRGVGLFSRRTLFAVAVLACAGVSALILYDASQPAGSANHDTPASSSSSVNVAGPPAIASPAQGVLTGSPDSAETLQTLRTFESMTEAELSSIEAAEIEIASSFSLDDLMPPTASFVAADGDRKQTDLAQNDPVKNDPAEDVPPVDAGLATSESVAQLLADDEASPDESPQETRTTAVMAIRLPPADETQDPTLLSDQELTEWSLDFPFEVPLAMRGNESPWTIQDTRKGTLVASVASSTEGTLLRWADSAGDSPNASALSHGRIRTGDGTIFLRPVVESDPWPLRVDQPDVMPTWNLADPIPPRVTRISVELDVPDEIEEAWIEPVDPQSPRRGRGLAVLTPKDGETVSLGLRFDLRCSRKLSCRVRYAGRLDPSMPWQVVSVPLLEQFADQLTHQATLVSAEAARLARVYEIAGSAGRRILRVKQGRNDAQADAIRKASERTAQLQALIATLETEGSLKIRVWVAWPDDEQDLLKMIAKSDSADD